MRRMSLISVGLVAANLAFGTAAAQAYTGQELANRTKISIVEARAIALKAHPGKITDEELEKERAAAACATPSTSGTARLPRRLV
jgi:hypothetical protein